MFCHMAKPLIVCLRAVPHSNHLFISCLVLSFARILSHRVVIDGDGGRENLPVGQMLPICR